jgi:glutamate-5-semialdehyde dehydrogenase
VNRRIAETFLPKAAKALREAGVSLRGTAEVGKIVSLDAEMGEDDFATEYNDLILSVKLVDDVREAVAHINRFGSHHTDCILTTSDENAEYFMQMVDSAGVYRNCSTRFADGYRYGFGAEVGISTGKLHARGPVGLEGLVTYKYRLCGHGQTVADYASGRKTFRHRDICC